MREDVRKNLMEQSRKATAREVLWPLIQSMPLGERGEPIQKEMLWVLMGKQKPEEHEFILPTYCYNIFEKFARTIFQEFPLLSENVVCEDPSKLAQVKTYEEAKQFLKLDWYRFGKVIGIPVRLVRFFDLEIEKQVKHDGLWELEPDKEKDVVAMLGSQWLEKKGVSLADLPSGDLSATLVKTFMGNAPDRNLQQIWSQVAFQWGPDAMSEFNRGIADGIEGFMDENGELAGETTRSNNYGFFLLLWPEIKEMLERDPLPNRTEVFQWVSRFDEAGLVSIPDIDNFHDFCESIGLKFAGRSPQKS
jgi:hypothetical protein